MPKRCVLVSGPSVSKDAKLINSLQKTTVVLSTGNNSEIVSILATHPVDAIILELSTNMSGEVNVIKEIKSMFAHIKIILVNGDRQLFVSAFRFGVKDAFRKPYRRDMLVERVKALLA